MINRLKNQQNHAILKGIITMNKQYSLIIILTILLISVFSYSNYYNNLQTTNTNKKIVNISEIYLTLEGWDEAYDHDFDLSALNSDEKNWSIKRGIEKLIQKTNEEEHRIYEYSELLSSYYDYRKDYKIALFWAHEGARLGNEECMGYLAYAYMRGIGVVQDDNEAIKWSYLAAALGQKKFIEFIKVIEKHSVSHAEKCRLQKGKHQALEWMQEHPKAFSSAN